MDRSLTFFRIALFLLLFNLSSAINAQFVHPGCSYSKGNLDRFKEKVLAKEHPWIDGWNMMLANNWSGNWNDAVPHSTVGGGSDGTRQRAAQDATMAYYNFLRWYVTGDTTHAECAVRIMNAWTNAISQVVTGELLQLPIWGMVQTGELLRMYPGWKKADFEKFKYMCLNYFYPASLSARSHPWPGWGGPANLDCLEIAILCDDQEKFDDALEYYKSGAGGGSINNAVMPTGQLSEMGRDQPHAEIGINSYSDFCKCCWNQNIDLYSYEDNRLLNAYEYFCKFNLNHPVEWETMTSDKYGHTFFYPAMRSEYRVYGGGAYQDIYDHYVNIKGLSAPYTRKMINLHATDELYGFCTSVDTSTVYTPQPRPSAPTQLTATAGVSNVTLKWKAPDGDISNGSDVLRATSANGPFTKIYSWRANTSTSYIDTSVVNNVTYYYKVTAMNQSGMSGYSEVASAMPVSADATLPMGWTMQDIGTVTTAGSSSYTSINNQTFILNGSGVDIWGTESHGCYVYTSATGDFSFTARVFDGLQDANIAKQKIGLMLRENIQPDSKNLTIHLGGTQTRGATFSWRSNTGGSTNCSVGCDHTWMPVWFKMERKGDVFTAYQSSDGVHFFIIGSETVDFAETYQIGFFVCGGTRSEGLTYSSKFDNVSLVNSSKIPAAPILFKATIQSSSSIKLTWTSSENAAAYNISRSTNINGPYKIVKSNVPSVSYLDSDLDPNTTYYYSIKSTNFAGESTDATQTNATTLILKLPSAPTNLKATALNEKIKLQWTATGELTSSYKIKRKKTISDPYTVIGVSTTNSYIDETAMNDSTYYYVISAVNSLGEGTNSASVNAKASLGEYLYWPFNEGTDTITSSVLTTSVGSLMNGGCNWTTGRYNKGINLNSAKGGYISLPNGITSNLTNFTISAWVYLNSNNKWGRIFDFGTGTNQYMFLSPKNESGYMRFVIKNGGSEQFINTTYSFAVGSWTHVAVTMEDSVSILYINGNEVGRANTITINPAMFGVTTQNFLGKSQWSSDAYLNGKIDEFRIYKQALSATQIKALKNAQLQTITFGNIPIKHVGDSNFSPAVASSGLTVSYTSSARGVAQIIGGNIRIVSTGTSQITASQNGNLNYVAALPVMQTLLVEFGVGVNEIDEDDFLKFYYDPLCKSLIIDIKSDAKALAEIYNINGQKMISREISGKNCTLDLTSIPSNVYVLKIIFEDKIITRKIIKE